MILFMLGFILGAVVASASALLAIRASKRQLMKQVRPIAQQAADAALAELRQRRDAGDLNADEEIVVGRMERLAASRPRREGP